MSFTKLVLLIVFVLAAVKTLPAQPVKKVPPSGAPEKINPSLSQSRSVWIPYWTEEGSRRSTLHVRNALHHSALTASVEVLAANGTRLAGRDLPLPPLTNLDVPLSSILPAGIPSGVRTGAIRVSYSYPYEGVLQGELSIRDDKLNLGFTIVGRRVYRSDTRAAYLAVQLPSPNSSLEAAFSNATEARASVALSVRQGAGWKPLQVVELGPNATQMVRFTFDSLTDPASVSTAWTVLLKADYSVSTGEIVSNAWFYDEATGFSNTALLHDEYPNSNELYGTQVVSGSFSTSVLARGPVFDGSLVFVNLGEGPSEISGALYCSTDAGVVEIPAPPLQVTPFTPQVLPVQSLVLSRLAAPAVCSARFRYSGKPGHVMGRYYAKSESKTYGLYVKLEPFVGRAYNEVYWSVQDEAMPLVSVSNFSDKPDTAVVFVTRSGTPVEVLRQIIPALGTITVNLKDGPGAAAAVGGDYGGMYIRMESPTGKLLVKQHALNSKKLTMMPYYGGYDYITMHYFSNAPVEMYYGDYSHAAVTTCYAISGCYDDDFPIYSSNSSS